MNRIDESRRRFLHAAGLGAVGAAAAVLAPVAVQAEPAKEAEDPQGKGYRLTDHVRKYYETTRL